MLFTLIWGKFSKWTMFFNGITYTMTHPLIQLATSMPVVYITGFVIGGNLMGQYKNYFNPSKHTRYASWGFPLPDQEWKHEPSGEWLTFEEYMKRTYTK